MAGDAAPAPAKPAGDFDYESLDSDYSAVRRTDPRIAQLVHAGLGSARSVVNVGAGAGSYEPFDLRVTPVEPSAYMRSRRSPDLSRAINAVGENLPFFDASFDAAMAMVTVHQWSDHERGLRELRRVSRGPVVILTFDGDVLDKFWLASYVPGARGGRTPPVPGYRSHLRHSRRDDHRDDCPDSDRLHGWVHRGLLCSPGAFPRPGRPPLTVRMGIRSSRRRAKSRRTVAQRPGERGVGPPFRIGTCAAGVPWITSTYRRHALGRSAGAEVRQVLN